MEFTATQIENVHLSYNALTQTTVMAPTEAAMQKLRGKVPEDMWQAMKNVTNEQLSLLTKFARALPEEEFVEAVQTNEWPPIKLTSAELEMLKGGGWRDALITVACGAVMGAATCMVGGMTIGAALLAGGVECVGAGAMAAQF